MKLWVHALAAIAGLAVPASLEAWSMTKGGPRSSAHYAEITLESHPKDLIEAYQKLAFDAGKPDEAAAKYRAPNFVDHAAAKAPAGPRAVEHVIGDGDLVAVHQQIDGAALVDIYRVAKGKIVEHWDAQAS